MARRIENRLGLPKTEDQDPYRSSNGHEPGTIRPDTEYSWYPYEEDRLKRTNEDREGHYKRYCDDRKGGYRRYGDVGEGGPLSDDAPSCLDDSGEQAADHTAIETLTGARTTLQIHINTVPNRRGNLVA